MGLLTDRKQKHIIAEYVNDEALFVAASGWLLIPLCWSVPMTVTFFNRVRDGRSVGLDLKICSLLFVSLVAGICMLCRDENVYPANE